MSNKHSVKPPTDIILARLKVLFKSLNDIYQNGNMVLEGDIISSYHEAMELFYDSFDKSIVGAITNIKAGFPADPAEYNRITTAVQKDIETIFTEVSVLDRLVSSSFNSIMSEREQVLQTTKIISNKLADYLLYADPSLGAGYFFGDSFNTIDKIETGSSLVDSSECTIDTDEGIILLPLDGSPDRVEIKSFIINKPSNGYKGSNYQINVFGHDTIETIGDGEANTWFEYEKVTTSESSVPLILDLTIVLKEISIINHININPLNFGTPSPVFIKTLETSKDGVEYRSIKDEIPIKDFVSEEENNVFELSPSTSKNSGQGFYSFLPRKAQYIHIVLEQNSAYSIQTNNGVRLRYAIGIRDINILQRKFKTTGSVVSTQFTIDGDTRKVSLWASENPNEKSVLSDISHFLSHDDGATWLPIQPQERIGFDIPEVINFNNISENSITTDTDVNTFRHKISMSRDTKAFSGDTAIKQEKLSYLDIVNVPSGSIFNVTLTEKPISNTVRMLMPYTGSFSCPRPRYGLGIVDESPPMDLDFVKFNIDVPGSQIVSGNAIEGTVRYNLPFRNIPNLEHKIRVFHNGAQIEYLPKDDNIFDTPPTSHNSPIDVYSKVYFLNKKGTEIQFGYKDSTGTQRGFIPASGSRIEICLDGDNPTISITDRGYVLNLTTPSDGQKEYVSIVALKHLDNSEAIPYTIEVPSGVAEFKPIDISATLLPDAIKKKRDKTKVSVIGSGKKSTETTGYIPKAKKVEKSSSSLSLKNAGSIKKQTERDVVPSRKTQEFEDLPFSEGTNFSDGSDGMLPPIFLEGVDNFYIKEFDRGTGEIITGASRQFTDKVEFVDGDSELRYPSSFDKVDERYTFDPFTGSVYLGSVPWADRRVVLVAQKLNVVIIPQDFWEYDRDLVTNRINTQKILLDPSIIYTIKQKTEFTYSGDTENSINLLTDNEKTHSWFNKRIIKGSVIPSVSLFPSGSKPTEVPFIDGKQELMSVTNIEEEPITFTLAGVNLYSFTPEQLSSTYSNNTLIGSISFGAVRSELSTFSPVNIFNIDGQIATGDTPSAVGEWVVDEVAGDTVITVYSTNAPESHVVSYQYKNTDPGIDTSGLYSVDYQSGTIYFSENIPANGEVKYEVSAYSAFYNIAKIVPDSDIREINEEEKTISFNPSYGLQFIKQDTTSQSRPQILKVLYDYYKVSTESLADLEPYFSPICKDIAFKAVTSTILEEL